MSEERVTEKSTKRVILEALRKAEKKLENLPKDPVQSKKSLMRLEENNKIKERVNSTPIEDLVQSFRTKLNENLGGFEGKIFEYNRQLKDLENLVNIEKKELERIHEIKVRADTLEALIFAHQDEMRCYQEKREQEKKLNQALVCELEQNYQETEKRIAKENERNREEYEYEWGKKLQKDEDAWIRSKEERMREILKKEASIEEFISEFEKYKTFYETHEAREEKLIESAVAKAVAEESKSRELEIEFLKKDFQSKEAIMLHENKSLLDKVVSIEEQNKDLRAKLNSAYLEIRATAKDAIEGASKSKVFWNPTENKQVVGK